MGDNALLLTANCDPTSSPCHIGSDFKWSFKHIITFMHADRKWLRRSANSKKRWQVNFFLMVIIFNIESFSKLNYYSINVYNCLNSVHITEESKSTVRFIPFSPKELGITRTWSCREFSICFKISARDKRYLLHYYQISQLLVNFYKSQVTKDALVYHLKYATDLNISCEYWGIVSLLIMGTF